MEVAKKYTDENYIAINDLQSFGDAFVVETENYRNTFVEMVPLNDLDFVKIVETPALVKKRYIKNVELKGQVDINSEQYDYILEMAKDLVNGKEVRGIDPHVRESIIKKYIENKNDLTIITNYLANNTDKLIVHASSNDIESLFPELSNKDIKFITKNHNINLHYTIQKYQDINKCSYETARKSLEKLVDIELFIKTKVGKKFVYKPTTKLNLIMKGDN